MRKEMNASAIALVVICSLLPGPGRAQVASTQVWSSQPGYLGIENFQCDCTLAFGSEKSQRRFVFRSEPVITGIADGSPAEGLLQGGDVITRIDGISLLTLEGGRRFASIDPGDDVHLTIKRDGRTMQVSLRAVEMRGRMMYGVIAPRARFGVSTIEMTPPGEPAVPAQPAVPPTVVWAGPAAPAPLAAPATPAAAAARAWTMVPRPPVAAMPGVPAVPESPASPRAWFGFSIRCNECGWASTPGTDPVWESDETPEIYMIASEGPASRAGLQAGDRIVAVDGMSILSRPGARRFGGVRPGQTVRLTIKRGSSTLTKELHLVRRPEEVAVIAAEAPRAPAAPLPPSLRRELRYTGKMDNVSVQVWSAGGPTVERVGNEMIVTIGGSVVRIKVDPKK